jgi:hypothetical protein
MGTKLVIVPGSGPTPLDVISQQAEAAWAAQENAYALLERAKESLRREAQAKEAERIAVRSPPPPLTFLDHLKDSP